MNPSKSNEEQVFGERTFYSLENLPPFEEIYKNNPPKSNEDNLLAERIAYLNMKLPTFEEIYSDSTKSNKNNLPDEKNKSEDSPKIETDNKDSTKSNKNNLPDENNKSEDSPKIETDNKESKFPQLEWNFLEKYIEKRMSKSEPLSKHNLFRKFLNHYCDGIFSVKIETESKCIHDCNCQITEFDIFILALLTNSTGRAAYLWRMGRYQISYAMIASVICEKLKRKSYANGFRKSYEHYEAQEIFYRKLANGVLDEACMKDKVHAKFLLLREIKFVNNSSCLILAYKLNYSEFFQNRVFNIILHDAWYGRLPSKSWLVKILLNLPWAFLTTKLFYYWSVKNTSAKEIQPSFNTETCINRNALSKYRSKIDTYKNITTMRKILSNFYNAPIVKFMTYLVSYLIFIGCLSYVCLVELRPLKYVGTLADRQMEIIVYIYVISFGLEEMRQAIERYKETKHQSVLKNIQNWITDFWNLFDTILLFLFLWIFIGRNIANVNFSPVQSSFSLMLSMFCFRFFQFFYFNSFLGKYVILIGLMIKETIIFLAFYAIAIYAFGALQQGLLYPNSALTGNFLQNIVYQPYWQLYGGVNFSYIEGKVNMMGVAPTPHWLVAVACAVFMAFTNVLFLNLLIAKFNQLFGNIEAQSFAITCLTQMEIFKEFYNRPILPPPFNIIELLIYLKKGKSLFNDMEYFDKLTTSPEDDIISSEFEKKCAIKFTKSHNLFNVDQFLKCFSEDKKTE